MDSRLYQKGALELFYTSAISVVACLLYQYLKGLILGTVGLYKEVKKKLGHHLDQLQFAALQEWLDAYLLAVSLVNNV